MFHLAFTVVCRSFFSTGLSDTENEPAPKALKYRSEARVLLSIFRAISPSPPHAAEVVLVEEGAGGI